MSVDRMERWMDGKGRDGGREGRGKRGGKRELGTEGALEEQMETGWTEGGRLVHAWLAGQMPHRTNSVLKSRRI